MTDQQMLSLRPATPADQAAVDGLLARSYPALLAASYAPELLSVALPRITRARPELLACGTYWLALRGDRVVGAGGWTQNDPSAKETDPEMGHIRHVATDPDCLRLGIARSLMQRVMDEARAAGMQRLGCLSTLTAVPFYQAMGFAVLAAEDVQLPGGTLFPSVRMVCILSP
ncbi:GNAT family N-acetyltransferase [Pseudorhodobacter sp. E13]|uniref:GNAT family N-acetyltransferase n=1 Tax=Pseudorhodobacter sp. E13 TaxID=2487931 RepID=UPI000F8E14C6|nr:GNAT family N-acetyltransferase [Pseudorhodobacter sp. E13]RUS59371.1 GNAT family N-acetyltransferase [Pseudorhodobacter sp. E13]